MLGRSLALAFFGLLAGCLAAAAQGTQTTTCSAVFPSCAECSLGAKGTQVLCAGCVPHFGFKSGACVACNTIAPECTSCADGACTGCTAGHGTRSGGAGCLVCSQIVPQCTECGNGLCTSCQAGYGVSSGGASCATCESLTAHCTQCATGKCTVCGGGFAADQGGRCLEPGTESCRFDVGGQCCRCRPGEVLNSSNGECVGVDYGDVCKVRQ